MEDSPEDPWHAAAARYRAELAELATDDPQAAIETWGRATEAWWQGIAGSLPGASADTLRRLLDSGHSYLRVTGSLPAALRRDEAAGVPCWWQDPVRGWERWLQPLLALGPNTDGPSADGPAAHGPAADRYRRALGAWGKAVGAVVIDSLEGLRSRLGEPDVSPPAPQALYRLWVECAETRYRELVESDDYAGLYAELVNATVALVDASGRGGFDDLLEGLEEIRRSVDDLEGRRDHPG